MKRYVILLILLVGCGVKASKMSCEGEFRLSKKEYTAIDSLAGRGKYLILRFNEPRCCKALYIEQQNADNLLRTYQLESFDGLSWIPILRASHVYDGTIVFFDPIVTSAVRLHHLRAERVPNIAKFVLYE